jgi:hypothetical protein
MTTASAAARATSNGTSALGQERTIGGILSTSAFPHKTEIYLLPAHVAEVPTTDFITRWGSGPSSCIAEGGDTVPLRFGIVYCPRENSIRRSVQIV